MGQGNRSSQIDGWLHHSKINCRPTFPWFCRIGIGDGVSIEKGATESKHTSHRRSVSRSGEPRRTTDFSEGDTLLIWSLTIFDLLHPVMKFKDYRDCSVLNGRTTTFSGFWFTLGASMEWPSVGQCFRRSVRFQVARLLSRSDKCGNYTIKKFFEEEDNEITTDWDCEKCMLNKLIEEKIQGPERDYRACDSKLKERGKIPPPSWKTRECFQWKANGSCSKETLCSFLRSHASGNRETAAEGAKNTGVSYPASNQPLITSEGEKGEEQASSSVRTGKRTDWREKLNKSRGQPCDQS